MTERNSNTRPPLQIVYDGECPFCASYVRYGRIKKQFDRIELVNAREAHPTVSMLSEKGFDLNEGMAVVHDGTVHFGADAMHFLALMTTRSDMFNRFTGAIFSHAILARALYPALKLGRRLTLMALGRTKIGTTEKAEAQEC